MKVFVTKYHVETFSSVKKILSELLVTARQNQYFLLKQITAAMSMRKRHQQKNKLDKNHLNETNRRVRYLLFGFHQSRA